MRLSFEDVNVSCVRLTLPYTTAVRPMWNHDFVLTLELVFVWVSFAPLFPLLTAPRREGHEEEAPSPVPRLVWTVSAVVLITSAAAAAVANGNARPGATSTPATADRPGGIRAVRRSGMGTVLARGTTGLLAGAVIIHAVAVTLGAPIMRQVSETWAFSMLIAALTSLPVAVSHDRPLEACMGFLRGTSSSPHQRATMVPAAVCALGAWLGAIPLCLDWEQPWQAWPLPMCVGGLLGFSSGIALLLGACLVGAIRRRWSRSNWLSKSA